MAKWLFLLITFYSCRAFPQNNIRYLRFEDSFEQENIDSTKYDYLKIKHLPLRLLPGSMLALGGEIRYQSQYFRNEAWSGQEHHDYLAFFNRFLFHGDLKINQAVRVFTQFASTFVNGKTTPITEVDANYLDIHQSFADINLSQKKSTFEVTLRGGRQELLFGSQRIIAVREGPNNRLSFDAIRLNARGLQFSTSAFYGNPVSIRRKGFDKYFIGEISTWGLYNVLHPQAVSNHVDLYYIGYRNNNAAFFDASGTENRHSVGIRLWDKGKKFMYDFEAVYQFGALGKNIIRAYTTSLNFAFTLAHSKHEPMLGLKFDLASGDRQSLDGKLNTFNPLFPRGAYFGLAALIGPSNLMDFHPYLQITIAQETNLLVDYDIFQRQSINDGIYGPEVSLIFPRKSGRKTIGNQLGLSVEYEPNQHLLITHEFTWFQAGTYLKHVSDGKDLFFSAFTVQFKF